MLLLTDSAAFAERLMPAGAGPWEAGAPPADDTLADLAGRLFGSRQTWTTSAALDAGWPVLYAAERAAGSQFDTLVALSRAGAVLPDGTLAVAGAGSGLHGQRGRPWSALDGNLHLSMWLAPPAGAVDDAIDLLAMAAVSVVDAIDDVPGLGRRAGIKWVNDILLDGAKVCGILTHVAHRPGGLVGVVGIGLNVEARPEVAPTPFVRAVTSLRAASPQPDTCRLGPVLQLVLAALDRNYQALRQHGAAPLLRRYRERSLVVGRRVALCGEAGGGDPPVLAQGRVRDLGPRLELLLDGHDRPFTTGRLRLLDEP